jgi:hypothetical protein
MWMGTDASGDLRQDSLNGCPLWLQETRKLQRLAKRICRFVDGKARIVRGDLEQDSVRLAEVDGPN